ncbi:hypothetical protein PITC_088730 [Penicillium italicum]|uniref:GPI anchored serine-rich protein n=1 Tax=Penicillium italicum TaxID=40296 RepID=A0A0A2L903_PENIT|nr:hypothetical protein PITC_088730 [Penicillium italicum]
MRFTTATIALFAGLAIAADQTVYETDEVTITSCAPTVTDCPARKGGAGVEPTGSTTPSSAPAAVTTPAGEGSETASETSAVSTETSAWSTEASTWSTEASTWSSVPTWAPSSAPSAPAPGAPAPSAPGAPDAPAPSAPGAPGAPAPSAPSAPGAPAPSAPSAPGAPAPEVSSTVIAITTCVPTVIYSTVPVTAGIPAGSNVPAGSNIPHGPTGGVPHVPSSSKGVPTGAAVSPAPSVPAFNAGATLSGSLGFAGAAAVAAFFL